MRKAIQMMFHTYVASRSVMFERSILLHNIEALFINSPVPPVIAVENAQQPRPFCVRFFLQKINILKKGRVQCIFANFIA